MAASTTLSQTQRYAEGTLLALALRQAQIHQLVLLGSHGLNEDPDQDPAVSRADPEARDLWTHDSRGLLRPVLRFLEIDSKAWPGVEKTAATSEPKHHIGAFLRKVFEGEDDGEKAAAERSEHELALAKAVDAMAMELEREAGAGSEVNKQEIGGFKDPATGKDCRRMTVLYMLLSACVADVNMAEEGLRRPAPRRAPAARDVARRQVDQDGKEDEQSRECVSPNSRWQNWKRGGIIAAAALTGGTLMAISGGLAAPAIAAGFSVLAPTLHTLIPVIGASGFAATATAAGHTAASVAVAASFGAAGAGLTGTKMAKRIGNAREFEFKTIGENHNQGRLAVGILVSGFAFNEDDFLRPWEGWKTNLESTLLLNTMTSYFMPIPW